VARLLLIPAAVPVPVRELVRELAPVLALALALLLELVQLVQRLGALVLVLRLLRLVWLRLPRLVWLLRRLAKIIRRAQRTRRRGLLVPIKALL
jgi:hypothetical protein